MPAEGTPVPVPRPRKPKAEEAKPKNGTNGHAVPDELRRLTRAVEELHAAAKEARLAPMRLEWMDEPTIEVDPARSAVQRRIEDMLGDYEGLRAGPIAPTVSSLTAPADPHTMLAEGLIRPGTLVMLAGPPGAAKSWAARQLALSLGSGTAIFLDRYVIPKALNVLVVDEDNGPDEEWRRDETLLAHLGLHREDMGAVRRVSLAGCRLDEESWQRWLRGQIRLHHIDLTILDPISEMHGGKELREDPAFRSMLAFLKRLKVDFPEHATVAVHHTRKRDTKGLAAPASLDDVRGQWGQTPDVVVLMSPMGPRRAKWEVHKRMPHSSLILGQVPEGELGEGGLKLEADESVQKSRMMENDNAVIDAVRGGLHRFADIEETLKMPKATLNRVLGRLVEQRLLLKDGRDYVAPSEDDDE